MVRQAGAHSVVQGDEHLLTQDLARVAVGPPAPRHAERLGGWKDGVRLESVRPGHEGEREIEDGIADEREGIDDRNQRTQAVRRQRVRPEEKVMRAAVAVQHEQRRCLRPTRRSRQVLDQPPILGREIRREACVPVCDVAAKKLGPAQRDVLGRLTGRARRVRRLGAFVGHGEQVGDRSDACDAATAAGRSVRSEMRKQVADESEQSLRDVDAILAIPDVDAGHELAHEKAIRRIEVVQGWEER